MASLEGNKIAAAVLTAGVVVMTAGFVSELIYPHPHIGQDAYPIQVAGEEGQEEQMAAAPAEPEELQPIGPLLAEASIEEGQRAARKCVACHSFEQGGPNKIGPNLWDVVGAQITHVEDFNYSNALQELSDQAWTYQDLNAFLENPSEYAPGTKMSFAGVRDAEERADIIAYLRSLSENPEPLPE